MPGACLPARKDPAARRDPANADPPGGEPEPAQADSPGPREIEKTPPYRHGKTPGHTILIKKMFRDVGLDEMCSSHSLRRTFITNLFQSGINTKIVSQLSGHSNVQTTLNYYYQETDEVLKDVVGEMVIR